MISCKPLCCLKDNKGNIIAQDYIDFIKQKIHRECKYLLLNANQNWTITSGWDGTSTKTYEIKVSDVQSLENNTVLANALSSHYKLLSGTDLFNNKEIEAFAICANNLIRIRSKQTTLDSFKSFLSSNNVTIVYKLNNTIEEDVDVTCELVQFENETNVYNSDGAEIEIEITNNKAISSSNESIVQLQNKVQNITNIKIVKLWENSNPSQAFAAKTITLNDKRENYDYVEVIWRIFYSVTDRDIVTKSTAINGLPNYSNEGGKIYRRLYTGSKDNTMQFTDCSYYETYSGNTAINNDFLIPCEILGYKIN